MIAPGAAGMRSTRFVDFHTGKPLHDAEKCHLNAAVFDFDWERQAGELLDQHPAVEAWVKNDRLGLVVPYRKEGIARKYLPDFVVGAHERRDAARGDQGAGGGCEAQGGGGGAVVQGGDERRKVREVELSPVFWEEGAGEGVGGEEGEERGVGVGGVS